MSTKADQVQIYGCRPSRRTGCGRSLREVKLAKGHPSQGQVDSTGCPSLQVRGLAPHSLLILL
jgi:hypothetical protein